MVRYMSFEPLITIGDAVSNFLKNSDPTTTDLGPISFSDVHALTHYEKERTPKNTQRRWSQTKLRSFKAASKARWSFVLVLWIITLAVAVGLSASTGPWEFYWASPFGGIDPTLTIALDLNTPSGSLLANVPQVVLSHISVLYNGLITLMLLASEFMDYAKVAKSMRVSPLRHGDERSTYYLQVPYKYGLPLTLLMAVLHWSISESLFIIHIDSFTMTGKSLKTGAVSTLGYSVPAIFLSIALLLLTTVLPVLLGSRRFPAGIPLVGHCSLAISTACYTK